MLGQTLFIPTIHGANLNALALHGHIKWLGHAGSTNSQSDLIALWTGDEIDGLVQRPTCRAFSIDRNDAIIGFQTSARCGRTFKWIDDLNVALLIMANHDANTDKVAVHLLAKSTQRLRPNHGRVIILKLTGQNTHCSFAKLMEHNLFGQGHGGVIGRDKLRNYFTKQHAGGCFTSGRGNGCRRFINGGDPCGALGFIA